MESPSTPDKHAVSSSSPPTSSQSTAATTAERVSKAKDEAKMDVDDATSPSKAAASKADAEVLTLDDSSDAEMSQGAETKAKKGKGKEKDAGKGTKRKSEASSSSAPSAKKSKPSTSKSAKASSSKSSNKADDADKKLVVLKGNKFAVRQNAIDVQIMASYLRERAAFVDYACKLFRDDKSNTLSDYPEELHPFIAKLVHESDKTLGSLALKIRADLKKWIIAHLTATTEDSRDAAALDEAAVAERITLAPLKTLISSLATRTNYGLSLSSLGSDYALPDGVKDVPTTLQYWVWEVEDEEMWVEEMKAKWEKRKAEREEIKSTCLSLFLALSESEKHALLLGNASASAKASSSTAKSKGKGKAKAEDAADEGEEEKEADKEGGEKDKKPVKEKKPKKEKVLTEEEKKEREDKARVKAEKEAEKEAKRKKREEQRAAKAEKEDEKARIKAEKEAEEKKKADIAKKQKSMFTSFFVKKSASPAPVEAGPSSSPAKSSSTSDFDRVFHPFTIRDRVTVAPVNRFLHDGKKVDVKIDSVPELTKEDALAPLKSHRYRDHVHRTYPEPDYIVRDTVQMINDASLTTQDTSELYDLLNDRSKIKVKLFKFHEDLRPGYVGTWTKKTSMVGARQPFGRETFHLNYDIDSEAEWEEEPDDPDAEDIGSDGGEDDVDGEAGENSDADSWLAEDDEIEYEDGYDADGDMVMQAAENGARLPAEDDDVVVVMHDPQAEKERKRKEREAKKRKAEKERRKKKGLDGPILPLVKGPVWQDDVETVTEPAFKTMRIHLLNDASFGLDPFTFVSKPRVIPAAPASSVSKGKENVAIGAGAAGVPADKVGIVVPSSLANGTVNTLKAKRGGPKQPFPEDKVAAFLRHVHGSSKTRPVLVDEFVGLMKEQNTPIKKNTIEAKLKELDVKKVKGTNVVDAALLTQYGISA